jgi:hypothetical protein
MEQGDLLRDEGIGQAEKNANQTWFNEAMFWVEVVAKYKPEFTTDDVWGWLESDMEPGTHDNRAMGAVMRKAQRKGWIEPTDRVRKSTRAVCHSRPVRVWESKLI